MSEVEAFWKAVSAKFGDNRDWDMLHPQEQQMVIHSINLLMQVLNRC